MQLIPDSMDFTNYMRETNARAKVRRASDFGEDAAAEFKRRGAPANATMFSTKLRDLIEFRPGEVTAWAGYSGHRKSMFSGQVALDLCVQRERVLIASFEMAPGRTLARMERQASGEAKPSPEWCAIFERWTDDRLWMFDHMGRIKPDECIAVCNYFAAELQGRHVFIDSMMMVCASEESMDEQKQFTTDLCRLAQETDLHVHLVTHCRKPQNGGDDKQPTKYDLRGSAAISDQCANVITVWQNKAKRAAIDRGDLSMRAEPDAVIGVEKQRNGEYEGKLKLWFHEPSLRFVDDAMARVEPYAVRAEQ